MIAGLPQITAIVITETDHQQVGQRGALSGAMSASRDSLDRLADGLRTASNINRPVLTGRTASVHPEVKAIWITRTARRLTAAKDLLDA
jgi:hypothetical protein